MSLQINNPCFFCVSLSSSSNRQMISRKSTEKASPVRPCADYLPRSVALSPGGDIERNGMIVAIEGIRELDHLTLASFRDNFHHISGHALAFNGDHVQGVVGRLASVDKLRPLAGHPCQSNCPHGFCCMSCEINYLAINQPPRDLFPTRVSFGLLLRLLLLLTWIGAIEWRVTFFRKRI